LLIASLAVGFFTGEAGWEQIKPFVNEMFYGALAFFWLDMGIVSAPFNIVVGIPIYLEVVKKLWSA
jgi:hypothetical protein